MVNDHSMQDHDLLIRLEGQVQSLTTTVAANATQAAERDARVETKVDRINGSIAKVELRVSQLESEPAMPIPADEMKQIINDVREMYPAFKLARWVLALVVTAFVGQSIAAVVTAVWFVLANK